MDKYNLILITILGLAVTTIGLGIHLTFVDKSPNVTTLFFVGSVLGLSIMPLSHWFSKLRDKETSYKISKALSELNSNTSK